MPQLAHSLSSPGPLRAASCLPSDCGSALAQAVQQRSLPPEWATTTASPMRSEPQPGEGLPFPAYPPLGTLSRRAFKVPSTSLQLLSYVHLTILYMKQPPFKLPSVWAQIETVYGSHPSLSPSTGVRPTSVSFILHGMAPNKAVHGLNSVLAFTSPRTQTDAASLHT